MSDDDRPIPPILRRQVDQALAREKLTAGSDAEAINALVNMYHGYRNAYEKLQARPAAADAVSTVDGGRGGAIGSASSLPPVFDFDGLRTDPEVIRNHDFMQNPAYVEAYRAGTQALRLDHRMYWRLHVVLYFAERGLKLDGDFVECGVWRGFFSAAIARYTRWADVAKTFYLFDTFEGLDPGRLTETERANTRKIDHLNAHFANCYEDARENFSHYPNVRLVRGFVPDTLREVDIEKVAYLSLDMNNVTPEIAAAEYFWDRLSSSAAIVLDDYGFVSYEAQKRGFDEFAARRGVEVLHLPTGQGVILKP